MSSVKPEESRPKKKQNRPKRTWRQRLWAWSWKSVVGLLLFVLALPFLLLLGWQLSPVRKGVRNIAVSVAGNFLEGSLQIGNLGGDLWSGLSIHDMRWLDRHGKLMVGWKTLRVRYDLWSYVRKGELLVTEVALEKPEGYVTTDAKGQLNVLTHIKSGPPQPPKPKPAPKPAGKSSLQLRVQSIVIDGLRATYQANPKQKPIEINNLQLQANYHLKFDGMQMEAQLKRLTLEARNPDIRLKKLNLGFWMKGNELGVKGLHLKAGKATELKLEAMVGLHKVLQMDVDLKRLFVHPDDIRKIAPTVPLQQPIQANLRAKGTLHALQAWLNVQAGRATIRLTASSGGLKTETYKANLTISHVDLQQLLGRPDLHSDLSLRLEAQGKGFSAKTNATALLEILPGHFQKKYRLDKLRIDASAKNGVATVKEFLLHTPFGHLSGKAVVDLNQKTYDGYLSGSFPQLRRIGALVNQSVRGSLMLKASGKGTFTAPKGQVSVKLRRVVYRNPQHNQWRWRARSYARLARRYQQQTKRAQRAIRGRKEKQARTSQQVDSRCRRIYLRAQRKHRKAGSKTAEPLAMLAHCTRHYDGLAAKAKALSEPIATVGGLTLQANLSRLKPLTVETSLRGQGIHAGGRHIRTLRWKAWAQIDPEKQLQTVKLSQLSFDIGTGLFRLERTASIQVERGAQARIQRLFWRNRNERIRLQGMFDWKRWQQDVRVSVTSLQLGPLRKALNILPEQDLTGAVSLDVRAKGSFVYPRLFVDLTLDNFRSKALALDSHVRVEYQWSRGQQRLLQVNVTADRRRSQNRKQRLVTLALRAPAYINLKRVALQGKLAGLLLLRRPFLLDLNVPDLNLGWVARQLKLQGIGGILRASIQLRNKLQDPHLNVAVSLKKARYQKKIRGLDADVFVTYRKGALTFSRKHPRTGSEQATSVALQGRKAITLAGALPVTFQLRERRGSYQFRYQLLDQPMSFSAVFERQQLGWLIRQVAPSAHHKMANIDGFFSGALRLGGKPTRPQFALQIQLEKGSFCPMTDQGFACQQVVGTNQKGAYLFRNQGDITQTLQKASGLKVKDVEFRLHVAYAPPGSTHKRGRLLLNTKLDIGQQRVLAMGKYASNQDTCMVPGSSGAPGASQQSKESQLALNISLNPRTLKPSFELFDELRFFLEIPTLNFKTLASWVRMDALRRLQGSVGVKTALCGTLSNPDATLAVKLQDIRYSLGRDADDREKLIDKANLDLNVQIRKKDLKWKLSTQLLGQPLLISQATIQNIGVGFDRKTFQVIRQKRGVAVDAQVRIPGFPLHPLAQLFDYRDKLYGLLKANLHIQGDPACLTLSGITSAAGDSSPQKGREENHITIEDLYMGIPRTMYRQRRQQGAPAKELPALVLRRFRLAIQSLQQGRLKIDLGMWQSSDPNTQKPDMLVGDIRWPVPLAVMPVAPNILVQQNRCKHWPQGKPSQQIKIALSRNTYPLSLRFVESFVPGLVLDADLDLAIKALGTTKQLQSAHGSVQLQIRRLAMAEHGLDILSNLQDRKLRKDNLALYERCQQLRRKRNPQTGVLDAYMKGCYYSYLKLELKPQTYHVEGRLQGRKGKPFLLYGSVPRSQLNLAWTEQKKLNVHIRSSDFQPMATPKHKLVLQTNIDISKGPTSPLVVNGVIRIPDFLYTLPESSKGGKEYQDHKDLVVLGEDSEKRLYPTAMKKRVQAPKGQKTKRKQVTQKQKTKQAKSPGVLANIKLVIPRGARIRNRELDLTIRTSENGALKIRWSDDALRLVGGVKVVRGDITFYSKRFVTQPGSEVQFMGQSLRLDEMGQLNANLDITAAHVLGLSRESSLAKKGISRAKILLEIKGTIQAPQINLSVRDASTGAQVALDKADILSLLLTGTTTTDLASGKQSALSGQALGAASSFASSQLQSAFSQVIPIDVLKINTGARVEDIEITIGKYITQRLYSEVQYKPTPLDNEDLWNLMFQAQLSHRWTLELRFGERRRQNASLFRNSTYFFFKMKR